MPRERIFSVREVIGMLGQFGIGREEAVALLRAQDMPALQKRLKEGWRKLAFQLHPDRGGDIEEFKRLSALYDSMEKLQPVQRPVAQPTFWPGVTVVTVSDGSSVYHQGTWNTGTWNTGTGNW